MLDEFRDEADLFFLVAPPCGGMNFSQTQLFRLKPVLQTVTEIKCQPLR